MSIDCSSLGIVLETFQWVSCGYLTHPSISQLLMSWGREERVTTETHGFPRVSCIHLSRLRQFPDVISRSTCFLPPVHGHSTDRVDDSLQWQGVSPLASLGAILPTPLAPEESPSLKSVRKWILRWPSFQKFQYQSRPRIGQDISEQHGFVSDATLGPHPG
ncbi:hypothetical protein BJX96DRAFT_109875 [Aspergillus floccosus]